ncbi:MAG: alpha/beta hydrolase family esterase [Clostridia bacterium]
MLGVLSRAIREGLLKRIGFHGARPAARAPTGRFLEAVHADAAGMRKYKAYLPKLGQGTARPLVVMLHGCRQSPDDFAAGTRMNELADELGFIVAYPQQARTANPARCWNWFRATDQGRGSGEPALIAGITREVIERHGADPRRVYVAGLSAGGAMAAIVAHAYPELYAAVGIHSGPSYAGASDLSSALATMRGEPVVPRDDITPPRPVPTIVFHGDDDAVVHASNAAQSIAHVVPADDAPPVEVENGEARSLRYTRTVQADASGRPLTEHWVIHGAGHAWSGGSMEGSFADPRGPDASREMLRFFLAAGAQPERQSTASPSPAREVRKRFAWWPGSS